MRATVLIPTHEHGRLLEHATVSALQQTVSDIEVFIVGDGPDLATRETAEELAARDPRVRFFDNPKGPRHGEILRHQALQDASGQIVCYLSDDDLWLPGHIEAMLQLLESADFAHSLPVTVLPDRSLVSWPGHLAVPESRERVIDWENFIPLSCAAHTLNCYRKLPHGWRTTPEGTYTDVYMWSQILSHPGTAGRSGSRVTVLNFASPYRTEKTLVEREAELAEWGKRIGEPGLEEELTREVVDHMAYQRAWMDARIALLEQVEHSLRTEVKHIRTELDATSNQLEETAAARNQALRRTAELEAETSRLAGELASLREDADYLRKERDLVVGSLTWRTRDLLLRIPWIAAAVRSAGTARARRARS